jgi:4-amino-4-deoxy-L-arabinose transferase-like glycosyltransferase
VKQVAFTCGAVAIALTCLAPQHAAAGDNFAAGLFGGLAVGTLFGIAAASPPPVVYYGPPPMYVASCYWTRGRPIWDSYRGIWVRPRIQVCD